MIRALLLAAALASPAAAQPAEDPHAHHHAAPAPPAAAPADPHAGHVMPPAQAPADPHAGHAMPPTQPADPHAAHRAQAAAPPVPNQPPPPIPTDHPADRFFDPQRMAAARQTLRREHGEMRWSTVMLEKGEYRPSGDGFAWEGRASFGGDIDRALLKTEGENEGHGLEQAEVQGLWSHAVGPYFDVQAGVRQDFQPRPRRTYAVLGVEGLAPYWFDVEAHAFLSDKGDLTARLEASYDLRLTQRVILEPRAEANLAAQDVPALGLGAGLTDLEAGLRLRYAVTPEFAPYVGVNWSRKVGDTADFARAAGDGAGDTRLVIGLRAWF